MFDKVLIANRGEIACRVIKTCKRLGIATVAVYSDADAEGLHVRLADEAVHIGGSAAAESYLRAERIIQAAKDTGAQAVHPGFGFLSEKADFVEALEAAGLVFIGPPPKAIAAMGDKIESKKIAAEAGVSTVPGFMGIIESGEQAVEIARDIGYPVMLKASAGGGGKGMRIAHNDREASDGFRSAQNEARSSFGDDRVFVEKFVEEPRHIEIQVLADGQGRTLYLGERECSIQRRHQKVIEEAPSPFIDAETRRRMGEQAVTLADAVGYSSAGTVEFIVDKDRNFYFLEMNTRLQVEHPVTEMITGLDLVEWMIRIAAGQALTLAQDEVKLNGWAIEARVYAEDPLRNFLPSIGRLVRYQAPEETAAVRVDTGVGEGSEISMFYDPMIAKLATWGETRDAAIAEMRRALDAFYIRGVNHNIPFLAAVMAAERFQAGRLTTNYIAEEYPDGFQGRALPAENRNRLVSVAAVLQWRSERGGERRKNGGGGVEPVERVVMVGREPHVARILPIGATFSVEFDGGRHLIESDWKPGQPLFKGHLDEHPITVQVDAAGPRWKLTHDGGTVDVLVLRPRLAELAELMPVKVPPDMSRFLLSPMPGLLVSLAVTEGQEIKAGEELAVVEAMKMENVLRAERDGKIAKLQAAPGDNLAVDQVIIEFD
ncbi:acetyl-CoA carboxylase biotin carboxylase subunit [Algihabitans albus]|uniref:acetyl-CoA carboxylase biotin carboxylase subunit n=1 Tax=Algihabitans albus TaxID=2164067 RepID=UPI000E5C5814|nr:acetyl/propionyl/methylcrotonyl-CoA carboxylase subunit alpha [Algihabitans albus]